MNKDEFDEHILKPEHNEKAKKSDSSKSIDNFLSAMRGYDIQWICIYSTIQFKMCFNPTKISIVTFFIHSVPETPSFWCKPCTLQCSSQVDFDMHCSGKAHNKKVLSQAALGNGNIAIPSPINPINIVNIGQPQQPLINMESSAFR